MSSPEPDYRRIIRHIRAKIDSGEWPPGHQLPTQDQLAAEFTVSKYTVDIAQKILKEAGDLVGRQGRGVFVPGRPTPVPGDEIEPSGR